MLFIIFHHNNNNLRRVDTLYQIYILDIHMCLKINLRLYNDII